MHCWSNGRSLTSHLTGCAGITDEYQLFARIGVAADCGWPAVPVNGRATIAGLSASQTQDVDRVHSPGTVAAYICDPGFDLIG